MSTKPSQREFWAFWAIALIGIAIVFSPFWALGVLGIVVLSNR